MTLIDLDQLAPTPVHPAANEHEAALLTWAASNQIDRPTPPLDRGRYKLPHPDTGKPKTWTRMSTLAKTLDDTSGLDMWRNRLIIAGLHANRHLLDAVDPDDNATLTAAANAAALHGGDKLRADLGTAMHTALEHHVLATGHRPPAPYTADLDAIAAAIDAAGLTFPAELVEATLVCPPLDAAGRTDLMAHGPWGDTLRIADLKTGGELRPISEAAQLAGYARSTHRWTPDGYQPTPDIDQTTGLLIHAPIGSGTCTIYLLDLTVGAEIADLCLAVRERRRGASKLVTPLMVEPATGHAEVAPSPSIQRRVDAMYQASREIEADILAERAEALRARIKAITDPADKALVACRWPDSTPHRPPWTWDQIDTLEHVLWTIDGIEAPFRDNPDAEPVVAGVAPELPPLVVRAPEWPTPDEGPIVADSATAALHVDSAAATDAMRETFRTWAWEAKTQHRPWGRVVAGEMTTRTHAINHAALTCAALWPTDTDLRTRWALAYVIGEDLQPTWRTGAVLGSLTIEQAHELAAVADRYAAGDPTTCAVINAATPAT